MNIHQNARLTPIGRERMVRAIVEGGQTPQAAARAAGVCPRTARKWVDRFKAEGLAGLADRSSRPRRLRRPTSPAVVNEVSKPGRIAAAFTMRCTWLCVRGLLTASETPGHQPELPPAISVGTRQVLAESSTTRVFPPLP